MKHFKMEHPFQAGGTLRLKGLSKRVLGTLLAVLMVASIFTALPLTVGAATEDTQATEIVTEKVTDQSNPVNQKKDKVATGAKSDKKATGDGETSGVCGDDLTWSYDSSTTTLTISGAGDMYVYTSTYTPWQEYKDVITNIVIENGVTSIGNYAFSGCAVITQNNITISNSVTNIYDYAFYNCSRITGMPNIPSGCVVASYVFDECDFGSGTDVNGTQWSYSDGTLSILGTGIIKDYVDTSNSKYYYKKTPWYKKYREKIHSIIISSGITKIGSYIFYDLTNLRNVTIPNSISEIKFDAFSAFDNTDTINLYITDLVSYINCNSSGIGKHNLYLNNEIISHVSIPNNLTSINNYSFRNCQSIQSLTIPNNITSIGDGAFQGCTNLSEIELTNNNISSIGRYAFNSTGYYKNNSNWDNNILYINDCLISCKKSGLSGNINIKNGTKTIGQYAFDSCSQITSVFIPESVIYICDYAFNGCTKLSTKPTIPEGCNVSSTAFSNCGFAEGSCGTNVTWILENGILTISGSGAMENYNTTSTTRAPWYSQRSIITEIRINDGVTTIGSYAFYYCNNLQKLSLPNSITNIGPSAFYSNSLPSTLDLYITNLEQWINTTRSGVPKHNLYLNNELLTNLTIPNSVTTIKNYAFNNCNSLASISFHNNITSIGENAFGNCTGLTSITIPNSVTSIGNYAFSKCSNLSTITLSSNSNLSTIGNYAFQNCTSLLSKPSNIPNNCSVSTTAFQNCPFKNFECGNNATWSINDDTLTISGSGDLFSYGSNNKWKSIRENVTHIIIENGITSIGDSDFSSFRNLTNITIPNSVTSIGANAFSGCSNLKNISIPNSVTLIGNSAFSHCTELISINIPNSVTAINNYTFMGCSNITNIAIPDNIISIGTEAFSECSNLETITISNTSSLSSIGSYAFKNCTSLATRPNIPQNCNYESNTVFYNCLFVNYYIGDNAICEYNEGTLTISGNGPIYNFTGSCTRENVSTLFDNLENITSLVIEDGITSIGDSAFENCTGLTSVTIPDSVTSIEYSAFSGCTGLTSVTIPNSVTSIDGHAFLGCTGLTSVTIPDSVTSIEYSAFFGCTGLTSVTIPNSITSIKNRAFQECTNLTTITIPEGVTTIDTNAFAYCDKATIVLPSTVTSMGNFSCYLVNRVAVPVDSYAYNLLTSSNFTKYRCSTTEVVGIVSSDQQFASAFSATGSPKSASSANKGSSKGKISTGGSAKNSTGADPVEEQLTAAEIAENLSHIRCYLVDDVEIDESVTFDADNDVVLHLNDFTVASNGDLIDGTPHTLEGSTSNALIEVPGDLTIKTTGEGQGGITNDSGAVFDVKSGGSLTIENGNYSEDVSEYIANNKVCGKTEDIYTVLNPATDDMTLDNDGREVIMPNNQDTFARNDLVGVQIRSAEEREYSIEGIAHTVDVKEAMRFVSVVRSDILRGAEDYGYVLVKGKSIDNMNARKSDIYVGSDGCTTVSLKGSKNTLANTAYSSANLNEGKYKYLTAAIKDIDDDSTAIGARFYIKRADGTYVYADYTCCATMGMIKAA